MQFIVKDEQSNIRIDKVIPLIDKNMSRTAIQRLLENGEILINDRKEKSSYKVATGDIITINEQKPIEVDIKAQDLPLDILYEDDDILVVNKAKGMVVHPGNGNKEGTLVNAIMAKCKNSLSGIGGEIRPRNYTQIG